MRVAGMKRLLPLLLAVGMLAMSAGPLMAAAPVARLTDMTGQVYVEANGAWVPNPTIGMTLASEDRVVTREGEATVTFDDGAVITLAANTNTMIQQWQEEKGVVAKAKTLKRRLTLFLGRMLFNSGSFGGDTQLATPTAVCGLRGTSGTLSVGADGAAYITFTEGGTAYRVGDFIDGTADTLPTELADQNPVQRAALLAAAAASVASQAQAQLDALPTDSPEATALQALSAYHAAYAAQSAATAALTAYQSMVGSNPDPGVVDDFTQLSDAARAAQAAATQALQDAIAVLEELGIPIPEEPSPFINPPTFNLPDEPGLGDVAASPT